MLVGYARVSGTNVDLTAQYAALRVLGVVPEDTHVDEDRSSIGDRPAFRAVLAALRPGDTLVVSHLDRLARSLEDARIITEQLALKGVTLNLGGITYNPTAPTGPPLFTVLGMVAAFEADLARTHTRTRDTKSAAKLRRKRPKLHASKRSTW
jgi:DNA invertase Pin-like site-specific DNA recombinase